MRIRLCVKRNGLPDANLLWPAQEQVNGTKQKIADLLTAVNETMPLESLNWALEDYVVEISGFECLHWQFLSDVLKEEDQVTIRPMEQVEVRARQLSGRHQISAAGFHLVDGVPFGTRPLRPLSRPSVVIPPRKRRRISTDEEDTSPQDTIEPGAQLSIANIDNDEQQLVLVNSGNATLKEGVNAEDERPSKRAKIDKRVHFGDVDDDDEDDEDDEDFDDLEDASSSDSSSEESSADDSDDESSEAPSEESLHRDALEGFDETPKPARAVQSAPPGKGKRVTRDRNKRRQNQKRIMHLIRTGILPEGSTKTDMETFLVENERSFRPGLEQTEPAEPSEPVAVSSDSSSSSDSDSDDSSSDSSSDFDEASTSADAVPRPTTNGTAAKSAATSNGDFGDHMDLDRAEALRHEATDAEVSLENEPALDFGSAPKDKHMASYIISGNSENPATERPAVDDSSSVLEAIARRQLAAQAAPKRARLNVDGAKRAIFGNLGQRTPKTKADEERVRAKLMDIGKPKKPVQEPEITEEEVPPESEAWRSKIRVMACECIDEGIILSEPPYPFQQRWDPQQQYWPKKKRNKKKRKNYDAEYEGEYYEGDGYDDSILLNYDEEDASAMPVDEQSTEQVDDLPALPQDITTLPSADLEDLKSGTVIVFKQLEIGANFMPEMTGYRTAQVEEDLLATEKGSLLLRLAVRDRKKKEPRQYDHNGNRIYKKFEMPMDEDSEAEEEDDGLLGANFSDLVDVKILKMASSIHISEEAVADAAAAQLRVEAENGVGVGVGTVEE